MTSFEQKRYYNFHRTTKKIIDHTIHIPFHIIPVSYTHLDVYKRQPIFQAKCLKEGELIFASFVEWIGWQSLTRFSAIHSIFLNSVLIFSFERYFEVFSTTYSRIAIMVSLFRFTSFSCSFTRMLSYLSKLSGICSSSTESWLAFWWLLSCEHSLCTCLFVVLLEIVVKSPAITLRNMAKVKISITKEIIKMVASNRTVSYTHLRQRYSFYVGHPFHNL